MTAPTDALAAAVDAEDAAIFTYGVSTAYVSTARRSMVAEYVAAHRVRRTRSLSSAERSTTAVSR